MTKANHAGTTEELQTALRLRREQRLAPALPKYPIENAEGLSALTVILSVLALGAIGLGVAALVPILD